MKGSRQRIEQALAGERGDRTPLYDLICNDAVIEHFGEGELNGVEDEAVVVRALGAMLDGTRDMSLPSDPGTILVDRNGNEIETARWTTWVKEHRRNDVEEWAAWIPGEIERLEQTGHESDAEIAAELARQQAFNARLQGSVYVHCTPSVSINEAMFGYHCGLDHFTFLCFDYPDLTRAWLQAIEDAEIRKIRKMAHLETSPMALIYSDVAFKDKLMFSRDMFSALGFFDNVARITAAVHEAGLQVIFHSDGYVMDIMADLVSIGIDGFNPIEKAAGMDIYELRRRFPGLSLVGGVDVTELLPHGSPQEVATETRRILDEVGSEGRLLIGTTTELDDGVPLENYLAFHDEVMKG